MLCYPRALVTSSIGQDTAKSMHDTYSGQTLLDLNRAGTPLIEIISDPDMHSTEQAAAYVRKVQSILCCIGSSDADMEKVCPSPSHLLISTYH